MASGVSRRGLLVAGAAGLAASAFPLSSFKGRRFRVAHMTDFHVEPELGAPKGMEMALKHAMAQKPDLVLIGGDCVMDAWSQNAERTQVQWEIFASLIKKYVNVPVHYAIGNHDLWGINKTASHTDGSEAKWGKKWFCEQFGYANPYHSFDLGGWHFVMLDNVYVTPDGYNGLVDDEQLAWLAADLEATQKPTLVVSHIPILSMTPVITSYNEKAGEWQVGGNMMTKNEGKLRELFAKHPNVKVAVSGHTHMLDRVDYAGVSYLCGGAVCGSWWKGANNGTPAGYRILELDDNGLASEKYLAWGWHEGL